MTRRRLALAVLLALATVSVLALRALPRDEGPSTRADAPTVAARPQVARTYDDTRLLQRRHQRAGDPEPISPELADPATASPLDAEAIVAAANAAVELTLAYTTHSWNESPEQRDARLAPLLTEHARAFLAGGSSAAAEVADKQRRQETARSQLAYSEPIEVTANQAKFLVAAQVTTTDRDSSHLRQQAYAVTVVPVGDTWLVDDLAPASPRRP